MMLSCYSAGTSTNILDLTEVVLWTATVLVHRRSYIHWRAVSAFWISGWICALSHLTLCSLRGKRQKEKKVLTIEGRVVKELKGRQG